MDALITWAVPVFIATMLLEAFVTWRKGEPAYRWADTYANLACGMGSQLAGLYITVLVAGIYGHGVHADPGGIAHHARSGRQIYGNLGLDDAGGEQQDHDGDEDAKAHSQSNLWCATHGKPMTRR